MELFENGEEIVIVGNDSLTINDNIFKKQDDIMIIDGLIL